MKMTQTQLHIGKWISLDWGIRWTMTQFQITRFGGPYNTRTSETTGLVPNPVANFSRDWKLATVLFKKKENNQNPVANFICR